MLRYGPQELDYAKLLRESRGLDTTGLKKRLRLALLGDCSYQHLAILLRVLLARHGYGVEVYESGYDTTEAEALNPDSQLYRFQPDFVVLLPTTWNLRKKYYGGRTDEKKYFAETEAARLEGVGAALRGNTKAAILQSNFVLPYERFFGNHDLKVERSFYASVQEMNRRIVETSKTVTDYFVNDLEGLASYVGRKHWFDEKMWMLAKALCAYEFLPFVAQNIVDIVLAVRGIGVKCVVTDLDNTLWGGIIGDDGLDGIRLGHFEDGEAFESLQHYLLELKERGVLLAVCSKNDPEKAMLPFQKHPEMVLKLEDFAVFIANWQNKAENIKQIREILNIGYDSMVFLDDSPFERQVVKEQLPQIIVPALPEDPGLYVRAISELNLFETTSASEMDKDRTAMYREEAERKLLSMKFSDPREYLRSLEMKITLTRFDSFNLPRIVQLMQRSNQFNLMTRRFNQTECEAFMADEAGHFPFYVKLRDKYGDYGLISTVVLRIEGDRMEIEEWLMSCRVLARGVEEFTMNSVFEIAAKRECKIVRGAYRPTEKNQMVRDFYGRFGFVKTGDLPDGGAEWSLETAAYQPREVFMRADEMEGGEQNGVLEPSAEPSGKTS
ncbi:MAG: HAD-IIIC family phosphatase [Candidatus Omnitrophota bacterium]